MELKKCTICQRDFLIKNSDIRRGRGRFCSRKCAGISHRGEGNPSYKHGHSRRHEGQSKEYRTWSGMIQRTRNTKRDNFKYYQDIDVCLRWTHSFEAFLSDMGYAPSSKHSIERIDNSKGYYPGNCRWATQVEQMQNIRANKRITFRGETHVQEEWGRITGLGGTTICKRLRRGWSVDEALTIPLGSKRES